MQEPDACSSDFLNSRSIGFAATAHQLAGRLLFDFFADARFDSLVFLFRDLFSHFSVGRIAAQNVRVEAGRHGVGDGAVSAAYAIDELRHRRCALLAVQREGRAEEASDPQPHRIRAG